MGPVSDTKGVQNHASAIDYPEQVQAFLKKEAALGGVVGPFSTPPPPFHPWCHTSPLMSRPKANPGDRRIITDMTFPYEDSVNAYIVKNGVFGIEMDHSLPTVDCLVQDLRKTPMTCRCQSRQRNCSRSSTWSVSTQNHAPSLLGHLVHVAKCVRPARLFIARILEALREAKGKYININADMRADLGGFKSFVRTGMGNHTSRHPTHLGKYILMHAFLA